MTMYILAPDGETPVPVKNIRNWEAVLTALGGQKRTEYGRIGNWFGVNADGDQVQVSTIFLGVDHNFGASGPPILWETMVFGCPDTKLDQYQQRYTSAQAARRGHHWLVWLVKRLGFEETTEAEE